MDRATAPDAPVAPAALGARIASFTYGQLLFCGANVLLCVQAIAALARGGLPILSHRLLAAICAWPFMTAVAGIILCQRRPLPWFDLSLAQCRAVRMSAVFMVLAMPLVTLTVPELTQGTADGHVAALRLLLIAISGLGCALLYRSREA